MNFNLEHNITPKTIVKPITEVIKNTDKSIQDRSSVSMTKKQRDKLMMEIEKEMMAAAKELDFERATELRDILFEMRSE
jgi:excinuclease ABC subunit B